MEKQYCGADQCQLDHVFEFGLRYHYLNPAWHHDRPSRSNVRRFYLERTEDVSGVSGTGIVADGVLWIDGAVTIRWRGERSSIVQWRSIEDVHHIHGHNGSTLVKWIDG